MSSFGPAYDPKLDGDRLRRQHESIRRLMADGKWRSLQEISVVLDFPEASVSAQLRHLRKPEFGAFQVDKRRRHGGVWEYRMLPPNVTFDEAGQADFFKLERPPMWGH